MRKEITYFTQRNKQHHRKVLLSSFRLNIQTLGFHPQTHKLESTSLYRITDSSTEKYCLTAFI